MTKRLMLTGSLFMVTGIILGAFGAHALKEILEPNQLNSFETGVRYQMYHGLAFLILGVYFKNKSVDHYKWSARLLFFGTLLFSGSIYLLCLKDWMDLPLTMLGPITPIGGVLLLLGWGKLAFIFWKNGQ